MRHSSPVDITGKIHGELAIAAVYHLNDMPSSRFNLVTPRMLVEGEKFTITDKDVLIPFGTVAHLINTEAIGPKSELGIVLGPSTESRHSYNCFTFGTRKKIVRSARDIDIPNVIPEEVPWTVKSGRSNRPSAMNHKKNKKKKPTTKKLPGEPIARKSIDPEATLKRTLNKTVHRPSAQRDAQTAREGELGIDTSTVSEKEPKTAEEGDMSGDDSVTSNHNVVPDDGAMDTDDEAPGTVEEADTFRAKERAARVESSRAQAIAKKLIEIKANKEKKAAQYAAAQQKLEENKRAAAKAAKQKDAEARDRIANLDGLRRSERKRIIRSWSNVNKKVQVLMAVVHRISVKEAMTGEHAQEAMEAIREEIQNMLDYQVGHYVHFRSIPKEKRKNILQSFMFLKHKTTPDGVYERTKARMVGNGANQRDHTYNLVSSSTVALASVFLMFNLASYYKCRMATYDIKGAFLHAGFEKDDEIIYIKINREVTEQWIIMDPSAAEYVDERGELLLELDKFIYGLKQSPLKFQLHLTNTLEKIGYKRTENDECMFIKHGKDGAFSVLTVHVDDILQVCTNDEMYEELKAGLTDVYGSITAHPEATSYLGMTIERSACGAYIQVSQRGLIKKIAEELPADPNDRKKYSTAASNDLFDSDASDKTDRLSDKQASKYLGLIMTLMYLARLTRPDVLLAVTYLASRTHKSTVTDEKHGLRVVRYLEKTIDECMTIHCTDLQIILHCDASSGTHREEGKGHTGFFAAFGNEPSYIHGRSAKQKLATLSSTEAEIVALSDAVKFGVWLRNLLTELQITPLKPIGVWQDNKSVLAVVGGPPSAAKRTKHLIARFQHARGLVTSGALEPMHKATEELSADTLTKPLQAGAHDLHTSVLMGHQHAEKMKASAVGEKKRRRLDESTNFVRAAKKHKRSHAHLL